MCPLLNGSSYGFGDPDMLTVGMVEDGANPSNTFNTSEQYTEISLWSLLGAPVILGCDLSKLTRFTYNFCPTMKCWPTIEGILPAGAQKSGDK